MVEMAHRRRKPTAKDVAEKVGVSVSTISRVMSGHDQGISEITRKLVLAAAQELRYQPNSQAGSLRRGYSRTVGIIIPDISDAYFHQVTRGFEKVAQSAGLAVILFSTERNAAKERSAVEMLCAYNVDAIAFAGGGIEDDRHLLDLPWDTIPVVTIGPHKLPFPSIQVDDAGTIRMATDHLLSLGRERILNVAGKDTWLVSSERSRGYRQALEARGVPYDSELVFEGDFSLEAGYSAVGRALDQGIVFDAVMAFNDFSAVGAILCLEERGIAVPEMVSVVGCDDILLAALMKPQLSSVSFPQEAFGAKAMEVLLDLMADRPVEPVIQFDYHLEIRESSSPSSKATFPVPSPLHEEHHDGIPRDRYRDNVHQDHR